MLPLAVRAEDPTKVEPAQQNTQLSPTPDTTDNRLAPGNADNQRPFLRDERVQDSRFPTPEVKDKTMAPANDRRAPVEVKETRDKTILDRKDYPKPEVRDRETSHYDGEKARIQPQGDMIKKYDTVSKYQNRLTDAETAASQRQPKFEKRTTFDKVNRFVFRRNAPGGDDKALVTPAGGGVPVVTSGGAQKAAEAPPPPRLQPASTPAR
ncbi:MAG: hypothetical protein JF599_08500 [Verrucomicrobia bacterium]|nr:hypothetical protein [Verrucomicrobiota bacterium]